MMLTTRKLGESIGIGDNIEVTVIEIKGRQVKLGVKAPHEFKVKRLPKVQPKVGEEYDNE